MPVPRYAVELTNHSSRHSFAKTFVQIFLRGLRNDRRTLTQIVARGSDEFVRCAQVKLKQQSGVALREEDLRWVFARLERAVDRLYKPTGWQLPKVH